MNVLYCTSEAYPFAVSGGLGDVAGSLPKAIRNRKVACRVVMPLYGDIAPQYRSQMKYICNFTVDLAWRKQYCGLFEMTYNGVKYYFLDNEYYFRRSGLYGFYDDGERFAFFSRAILEMLHFVDFAPDVIHSNDWQTALVNVYINLYYRHIPKFSLIKTMFTIHNIQYQGKYGMEMMEDTLGISQEQSYLLEYQGCVNYMKGAIVSADLVTTVSPTYAREIMDPWYAHGLDALLRENAGKVTGIVNGIDTKVYDPAADPALVENYDITTFEAGKAACKADLRRIFGLEEGPEPIVAMVSRLVGHKGIDLVKYAAEYLLLSGMQLVVLGSGETDYENFFAELSARYPGKMGLRTGFVPELAHKIYAGADVFLMPSKQEPCGLSQMVALRYGAIPVVRETGGLADTVQDSGDGHGNGFTFKSYNAHDMLDACLRAKAGYEQAEGWRVLVKRAMLCDHSWSASAKEYILLYERVMSFW